MTHLESETDRTRVRFTHYQHVDAAPETVFPLLFPVREFECLPLWAGEILEVPN